MAVEIRQLRWCDGLIQVKPVGSGFAPRHDEATPGEERTYGVGGRRWLHVDLCDSCDDQMTLAELRAVLAEAGVPIEAGKSLGGRDRQSAGVRAGASPGGVAAMVAKNAVTGRRQGRTPVNGRSVQCLWCPLDYTTSGFIGHVKSHGFAGTKEALGHVCPACGADDFEMVSVHIHRNHPEFASTTEAFIWARDNGDPFGVYKERRAAGQNVVEALA